MPMRASCASVDAAPLRVCRPAGRAPLPGKRRPTEPAPAPARVRLSVRVRDRDLWPFCGARSRTFVESDRAVLAVQRAPAGTAKQRRQHRERPRAKHRVCSSRLGARARLFLAPVLTPTNLMPLYAGAQASSHFFRVPVHYSCSA